MVVRFLSIEFIHDSPTTPSLVNNKRNLRVNGEVRGSWQYTWTECTVNKEWWGIEMESKHLLSGLRIVIWGAQIQVETQKDPTEEKWWGTFKLKKKGGGNCYEIH